MGDWLRAMLPALAFVVLLCAWLADAASATSSTYSALCLVGKNENRYVREWLEYHRCLGFSKVYLYDHNSTEPMDSNIPDLISSGFVRYVNYSAAHTKFKSGYSSNLERFMATVQGQAYKDCVYRFGAQHQFLGFLDFDEFLVIYDKGVKDVNDLLRQYEKYPGLSVYWVLLGSSGHKVRPSGGIVDSYTKCTPHNHKYNTQFKTFVNTAFKPTMYSPHRAVFASSPEDYMVNEKFERIQRGRNKNCTHERAAVFHYVTKSLEDFKYKMARGGGAGVTRPRNYLTLIDRHSTEVCQGAINTRRRFCK